FTITRLPSRPVAEVLPSNTFLSSIGSDTSFGSSTAVSPHTLSPSGGLSLSPSNRRYNLGTIVTATLPSCLLAKAQTLAACSPVTRKGRYSPSLNKASCSRRTCRAFQVTNILQRPSRIPLTRDSINPRSTQVS